MQFFVFLGVGGDYLRIRKLVENTKNEQSRKAGKVYFFGFEGSSEDIQRLIVKVPRYEMSDRASEMDQFFGITKGKGHEIWNPGSQRTG
jgi:hypothetical protein